MHGFALGDPADNPIFIETIPKRVYRFIAPVITEDEQPKAPLSEPGSAALLLGRPLFLQSGRFLQFSPAMRYRARIPG